MNYRVFFINLDQYGKQAKINIVEQWKRKLCFILNGYERFMVRCGALRQMKPRENEIIW